MEVYGPVAYARALEREKVLLFLQEEIKNPIVILPKYFRTVLTLWSMVEFESLIP